MDRLLKKMGVPEAWFCASNEAAGPTLTLWCGKRVCSRGDRARKDRANSLSAIGSRAHPRRGPDAQNLWKSLWKTTRKAPPFPPIIDLSPFCTPIGRAFSDKEVSINCRIWVSTEDIAREQSGEWSLGGRVATRCAGGAACSLPESDLVSRPNGVDLGGEMTHAEWREHLFTIVKAAFEHAAQAVHVIVIYYVWGRFR